MVKFTYDYELKSERLKGLEKLVAGTPILIGAIAFPLSIYFMIIGLFVDSEALPMGIPLLLFVFITIIYLVFIFLKIRKRTNNYYEKIKNGETIEYQISKSHEEYKWGCIQKKL